MQEKTLFKISLIISIVGIFSLLVIIEKIDIKDSNISSLTNSSLEEKVKIRGTISSIKNLPGILILNIKDNSGEITVIAFNEEEINLEENQLVEVEGKLKQYKNIIEIEADKIKVFK